MSQPGVRKPKRHTLYRFFNSDGELLYVGLTRDIGARWKDHEATKDWYREIASSTVEHFPTRHRLVAAENAAIRAEHPKYNVMGNHPAPGGTYYRSDGSRFQRPDSAALAALMVPCRQPYPCIKCGNFLLYKGFDSDGNSIAGVRCFAARCGGRWTDEEWADEITQLVQELDMQSGAA